MKRILCSCLSVLLLLATVLTFAACGEQKTQSQLVMDAAENTFNTKGSEAAAVSDMIDRIMDNGSITIALNSTEMGDILGKIYFGKNHTVVDVNAGQGDGAVSGTLHMTDKELVALCSLLREGAFGIKFDDLKDLMGDTDAADMTGTLQNFFGESMDRYARIGAERNKAMDALKEALVKALDENAAIAKETKDGTDIYTYTLDAEKVIAVLDALVAKIKTNADIKIFYEDYAKNYNEMAKVIPSGGASFAIIPAPSLPTEELPATLDEALSEENLNKVKDSIREEMKDISLVASFSVKKDALTAISLVAKNGEETTFDVSLSINNTSSKKDYTLVYKGEIEGQKGTITLTYKAEKTDAGSTLEVKASAAMEGVLGDGLASQTDVLSITGNYNKADGAFALNGSIVSVGKISVEGTYKRTDDTLTIGLSKAEMTPSGLLGGQKQTLPCTITITIKLGDTVPALPEYDDFTQLPADEQAELMMKIRQLLDSLKPKQDQIPDFGF